VAIHRGVQVKISLWKLSGSLAVTVDEIVLRTCADGLDAEAFIGQPGEYHDGRPVVLRYDVNQRVDSIGVRKIQMGRLRPRPSSNASERSVHYGLVVWARKPISTPLSAVGRARQPPYPHGAISSIPHTKTTTVT
jgi:hypothetical protein